MDGFPELNDKSGSWMATSSKGKTVELFERKDAELAFHHGWKVETAMQYLGRVNKEIREGEEA